MNPSEAPAPTLPRRSFLTRSLAAAAALWFTLRVRVAHAKKLAIGIDSMPELKKVGGSTFKKILGQPVLLIRVSEKEVRAFDPTCTHKKCKVDYFSDKNRFQCKCHKSAYDIDGNVLGGPAPKPLRRYRSKLSGDRVLLDIPEKE